MSATCCRAPSNCRWRWSAGSSHFAPGAAALLCCTSLSDGMTARLPRLAFAFRYHLLWMLRLEAMKEWQPSPIAVPTIVFSSGDALPGQTPDLGWGGLCAPLRIAPIGGTHASILQPPQLERLCARLLSALRVGGDIAPRVEAANDAQAASPTELPDLVRATELGRASAPRSA